MSNFVAASDPAHTVLAANMLIAAPAERCVRCSRQLASVRQLSAERRVMQGAPAVLKAVALAGVHTVLAEDIRTKDQSSRREPW